MPPTETCPSSSPDGADDPLVQMLDVMTRVDAMLRAEDSPLHQRLGQSEAQLQRLGEAPPTRSVPDSIGSPGPSPTVEGPSGEADRRAPPMRTPLIGIVEVSSVVSAMVSGLLVWFLG